MTAGAKIVGYVRKAGHRLPVRQRIDEPSWDAPDPRLSAVLLDDDPAVDADWFCESKDKDPAPEAKRQGLFLSRLHHVAPAVHAIAIPNAGKRTDWEALQRHREGMRRGSLDLVLVWRPTRPDDRGTFFAEFKNGQLMPTPSQREELNRLRRMGHGCGVYRNPDTLLAHLRAAGAPFISREGRL